MVFPGAAAKFFLDASVEERAKRRERELAAAGDPVPLAELVEQIGTRDERDRNGA